VAFVLSERGGSKQGRTIGRKEGREKIAAIMCLREYRRRHFVVPNGQQLHEESVIFSDIFSFLSSSKRNFLETSILSVICLC
jgi:molybdenum-dependent DNA-binding transcriptional regulator ModE